MTDTTAVIPGDLSKGEKEKVIQVPKMNISHTKEDATENPANEPNPDNISSNSAPDSKEHILYLSHLCQKLLMPCCKILLKNWTLNQL